MSESNNNLLIKEILEGKTENFEQLRSWYNSKLSDNKIEIFERKLYNFLEFIYNENFKRKKAWRLVIINEINFSVSKDKIKLISPNNL